MFYDPLVAKLATFVQSVGIEVKPCKIDWPTLFPGLDIKCGAVLVDETQLIHPGNILHEAGHVAVHDPSCRADPQFKPGRGEELSALAWSYAAVIHLGLRAELIFYPGSYQGWDETLIESFAAGRYTGVPLLQRYGMTVEPRLATNGIAPYPHMLRWVR